MFYEPIQLFILKIWSYNKKFKNYCLINNSLIHTDNKPIKLTKSIVLLLQNPSSKQESILINTKNIF